LREEIHKDNFQFGKTLAEQRAKLIVQNSPLGITSIEDVKEYKQGKLIVADQQKLNEMTGSDYARFKKIA
jgi:hypothetical protein